MIIVLKYTNFFFIYLYTSMCELSFFFRTLFLLPFCHSFFRLRATFIRGSILPLSRWCLWVLASLLNWKQNKQRGGAHGNMATATEHHGRLLRDRKSIPGSRYGSHRDCDSALYRDSGWNSFEYWLRSGSCCCCHHSYWPVLYLELGVLYPDIRKKLQTLSGC